VGYGSLGRHLASCVLGDPSLELCFVWNRTKSVFADSSEIPASAVLEDLSKCAERSPDVIVEVAHPSITKEFGRTFLMAADFMMGSPTALADSSLESELKAAAEESGNGLYVPSGALWGGEDIRKMADRGSLKGLRVTMRKHPSSLKLSCPKLEAANAAVTTEAVTLYDGPVRQLCPLAPNNVNTMAAAAVAAHNLGLDGTKARLISDPSLLEWHIVEVEVTGPTKNGGRDFTVETVRKNPADPGAVTGSATYASFYSSLLRARGKGRGMHLC